MNWPGDRSGSKLVDGVVVTPPGWKDAYKQFSAAGWRALPCPRTLGGQGLPGVVAMAVCEIWNASNMAFGLCPLLTQGAIDALHAHGSEELKATYLPKMVTGEWTGTMNLTEPQAGSDLGAAAHRARCKQPDGTYRISGTKIFITYGDHDMTDNIVHLVLARAARRAARHARASRCSSCPSSCVNADGTLGAAQRRHLRRPRAQARHPRQPDLRDELRRERRRHRLPRRRGEPRPRHDVHHDERRAAGGRRRRASPWPSGRPAGRRLRPGAPSGPRRRAAGRRDGADHRAPRHSPHAADHEGADSRPRAPSASSPPRGWTSPHRGQDAERDAAAAHSAWRC